MLKSMNKQGKIFDENQIYPDKYVIKKVKKLQVAKFFNLTVHSDLDCNLFLLTE
jgi:hypothetical protein